MIASTDTESREMILIILSLKILGKWSHEKGCKLNLIGVEKRETGRGSQFAFSPVQFPATDELQARRYELQWLLQ